MLKLSRLALFGGAHSKALTSLFFSRPSITNAKTFSMTAQQPGGTSYTFTIQATGEPTTYSATNLPAGMSMASPASLGQIIGAPLVPGTYTVTVSATNSFGTGSTNITFTAAVNNSISLPVIQNDIISATIGSSMGYSLSQIGGDTAYVYSASSLPSGFSINSSTGQITGTATSAAATTVTVYAYNAKGFSTAKILIVADNFTNLNLPVLQSPTGVINRNEEVASVLQFNFSNSPTSYVSLGLPNGIGFDKAVDQTYAYLYGVYTGIDTSSTFLIAAINAGGLTKETVIINWVSIAPYIYGTGYIGNQQIDQIVGRATTAISYQPRTLGKRIVYTAIGLPTGLSINATTGLISGTITSGGQYSTTIKATNSVGEATLGITLYISSETTLVSKAVVSSDGYKVAILRADGYVDEFQQPYGTQVWSLKQYSWKNSAFTFIDVSVGTGITLGLSADGRVTCWHNVPNYVSDQSQVEYDTPLSVKTGIVKAQAGFSGYNLALNNQGNLIRWLIPGPYTSAGSLYANTPTSGQYIDISISCSGLCAAVTSGGAVITWDQTSSSLTVPATASYSVVKVSAGEEGFLALKSDGTVVSWHAFDESWVGYDNKNPVPTPSPAGIGLTVTAIAANYTSFMLLNTVYRGSYSASIVYSPRDIVLYSSKYWIRMVQGSGQTPVADGVMYYWREILSDYGGMSKGSGLHPWFIRYFNRTVTPNRFEINGIAGEEVAPSSVVNVSSISSGNGVYLAVYDGGKVASWGRLRTNLPF